MYVDVCSTAGQKSSASFSFRGERGISCLAGLRFLAPLGMTSLKLLANFCRAVVGAMAGGLIALRIQEPPPRRSLVIAIDEVNDVCRCM